MFSRLNNLYIFSMSFPQFSGGNPEVASPLDFQLQHSAMTPLLCSEGFISTE
jgi:hypothetical protein